MYRSQTCHPIRLSNVLRPCFCLVARSMFTRAPQQPFAWQHLPPLRSSQFFASHAMSGLWRCSAALNNNQCTIPSALLPVAMGISCEAPPCPESGCSACLAGASLHPELQTHRQRCSSAFYYTGPKSTPSHMHWLSACSGGYLRPIVTPRFLNQQPF